MLPLLLVLAAAPRSPTKAPLDASKVPALVKALRAAPTEAACVDAASGAFLGTPYVLDPLGEGPGTAPDPDPTVRYDAVDCVTYVAEVLALCRARDAAQVPAVLQAIRYRGTAATYADRNHFMESGWVPSNTRKGFVRDITAQVAGADLTHDARTVTLATWHHRTDAAQLTLPDDRAPVGHFDLQYLPLDKVMAHARDIPSGAILLVAHQSGPRATNRISHLGFAIRRGGEVFVRHASSLRHQVIEDPLAAFVRKDQRYKRWPVEGYVFLQPLPAK